MVHLPSVPPEIAQQIITTMQRPEGTLTFRASFPGLLDATTGRGILLEVVSGTHIFQLVRDEAPQMHFLHASPGTGTRIASVDLGGFTEPVDRWFLALVWSPLRLSLHVGSEPAQGELRTSEGARAPFDLQVGRDGSVYRVGDVGLTVAGARVYIDGEAILTPPAIKLWADTRLAAGTLLATLPGHDFMTEAVVVNAVLSVLTTGFEAYLKERFRELEGEGLSPDHLAIAREFLSRREREALERTGLADVENEAAALGISQLEVLAQRINFQSYDEAKRAYRRAYGIRFGNVVSSQVLEEVQRLLRFRHRIVHVSPLLALLNEDHVPPEEPVFSKRSFADSAISTFDRFIRAAHQATFELRPTDRPWGI
jgi:hypothetical protein